MGGGGHLVEAGPPPGNERRRSGMGVVRWTAILFGVALMAFVLGTVVEGFWGSNGGQTNWVDQTFGAAMYLGALAAALLAPVLVVTILIAGTVRLRRRIARKDR